MDWMWGVRERDESRMNSRRLKFWVRVTRRVELLSIMVGKVVATTGVCMWGSQFS